MRRMILISMLTTAAMFAQSTGTQVAHAGKSTSATKHGKKATKSKAKSASTAQK